MLRKFSEVYAKYVRRVPDRFIFLRRILSKVGRKNP